MKIKLLLLISLLPLSAAAEGMWRRQFSLNGKQVTVTGSRLPNGQAPQTVHIQGPEYSEILADEDGNGLIDRRDIYNGSTRVQFTLPVAGRFQRLHVETRRAKTIESADFYLDREGKRYRLITRTERSYERYGDQTDEEQYKSCRRAGEVPFQAALSLDFITGIKRSIAEDPDVTHILDDSCRQPPFRNDQALIAEGVEQVFGERVNDGRYLSCMQQHGLGYYAVRLENELGAMGKKGGPSVQCEQSKNGLLGEFDEETGQLWIRNTVAKEKSAGQKKAEYGDVFFHESLHKAGVLDESLVHGIVSCCGAEGKNRGEKCKSLETDAKAEKIKSAYLASFAKNLTGFPEFAQSVSDARDKRAAATLLEDFLDQLRASPDSANKAYWKCTKEGKSDSVCSETAVSGLVGNVKKYFENTCPGFFLDKNDATSLCANFSAQAEKMVEANASRSCREVAGTDEQKFRSTCLAVAFREGNRMARRGNFDFAGDDGLLDLNDKEEREEERFLNSYLTAFSQNAKGIENLWFKLKTSAEPDRAEAMTMAFFKGLAATPTALADNYSKCLETKSAAVCAAASRDKVYATINSFFASTCPAYFTQAENEKKPCAGFREALTKVFERSISGGCKPKSGRMIGTAEANLTCVADALEQGAHYLQNYDSFPKEFWVDSETLPMVDEAKVRKRRLAGEISSTPARITRVASAQVRDFDPNNLDELKRDVAEGSTTSDEARAVLGSAAEALSKVSDFVVPSAQAKESSHSEPHSDGIGNPEFDPSANLENPAEVKRSKTKRKREKAEPASASSAEPESSATGNESAADRAASPAPGNEVVRDEYVPPSSREEAKSDAEASSRGGAPAGSSGPVRSSSGRGKVFANTAAQSESKAGGATANTNGASSKSKSSAALSASEKDELAQLRSFFENYPQEAILKLNAGELEADLLRLRVRVTDENGKIHGAANPQLTILYNEQARRFDFK